MTNFPTQPDSHFAGQNVPISEPFIFITTHTINDGALEGVMFSGAGAPDLSSNHGTTTFTGSAGSITVRWQSLHYPFENPVFDGSWTIVGASGAYAGLHGAGSVVFSVTGEETEMPIIDETWTGSVQ